MMSTFFLANTFSSPKIFLSHFFHKFFCQHASSCQFIFQGIINPYSSWAYLGFSKWYGRDIFLELLMGKCPYYFHMLLQWEAIYFLNI